MAEEIAAPAAKAAPEPAPKGKGAEPPPSRIQITGRYAYFDEDGRKRSWKAGDKVSNAEEIADLVGRKAPLKAID